MNLLCIPYAGGNRYSFSRLLKYFPDHYNIVVLEFPGRGERTEEALLTNTSDLVEDAYRQALPFMDRPYAIYGHSLGGLIGFLLARRIVANKLPAPLHLFVTGTTGPSHRENKIISRMPKQEFIDQMRRYKGMPDEILNNSELMSYFEPILRSDFQASETYEYEKGGTLDIPISVAIGTEDDLDPEGVEAWSQESTGPVDIYRYPGNHFFIFDHAESITKLMAAKLSYQ